MKREVRRARQLPAFKCDLAALESFLTRFRNHFPAGSRVDIAVNLGSGQVVEAASVEELQQINDLPAVLARVEITVFGSDADQQFHWCHIRRDYRGRAHVSARGPTVGWCAAAVEEVHTFAVQNRNWYWFLKLWMIVVLLGAVSWGPNFLFAFGRLSGWFDLPLSWPPLLTIFVSGLLLTYLWLSFAKIFPGVVICCGKAIKSWTRRQLSVLQPLS